MDRLICYDRICINFYDRMDYCTGGRFIQHRTPHGFRFVWTGKVRHPHSHEYQKQWDNKGDVANAATMFCKHIHVDKVPDTLIKHKRVELFRPLFIVSGIQLFASPAQWN